MSLRSDTADTLYEILAGKRVSRARLERACDWFEQLDTPLDRRSFLAYTQVLQRELDSASPLAGLVPRWRHARRGKDRFDEGSAAAFLQDYTAHLDPNLLFRAPITAGYARWERALLQQGFAFASQSEQAWSLLYCDRGGARLRAAGRDLPLVPGQVLLVAPGAPCSLQPLPDCDEWAYYWAVFHPDSRWRNWLIWPHFATRISHLSLPEDVQPAVSATFLELEHCLQSARPMATELSHNLMEQLILRCRASLPSEFEPHRDPRIERARAFVEEHFDEAFTLEDVAGAASMSVSRLASLFRQQCGLSVLGYRDELRMVQAAQLLRNSSMSIAAVGAAAGYPDPAYFSRTFSRHVGVSPREYQQQG